MLQYLSNAFNDPSNPWYYVIGVVFLLLLFGGLAVYVILSGKRKGKDNAESADSEASVPERDDVTESTEDLPRSDKE